VEREQSSQGSDLRLYQDSKNISVYFISQRRKKLSHIISERSSLKSGWRESRELLSNGEKPTPDNSAK
jgi:hypothetical protein